MPEHFMESPGQWFKNNLPGLNSLGMSFVKSSFKLPTTAYHASSIEQAAQIVKHGGLQTGVAVTDGAEGIDCEPERRLFLTLNYGTHSLVKANPALAISTIFQLCVDRSECYGERRVANRQWVQQEHNVFIVGIYTHLLPIAKLYTKGFNGWYRIHCSVFAALHDMEVDEDGRPVLHDM